MTDKGATGDSIMTRKLSYEELLRKVRKLERESETHRKTKEALLESKRRYQGLRQASFEGIGIHENGIILEVNQVLAKMTGYKASDLIGMNVVDIIAPEWHDLVWQNIRSGYEKVYELYGLRKNGTTYPAEIRGKNVVVRNRKLRVMSFRDITERKQAQELYKTLAEKSQAGVYIIQNGAFKFLNERAAAFVGYRPEDLIGKRERKIIHPEDWKRVAESAVTMLRGKESSPIEFRIVARDGQVKWMMVSITSMPYGGKPAILGNVMDITELKAASDKLEEMEALEASILDAIPHAVLGVVDRHVVFANNATESVLGWKPEELIKQDTRILYETDEEYNEIGRAFYGAEEKRFFMEHIPCRKKSGESIICRVSASRIGDSWEEKKIVVVYEDITEKVKMDEALHEERDRAQQYLDIAGAIILAIDQHGTVMLINQRGAEILKYSHDEIVGRNWFDNFIPERMKNEVTSILFRLIAGGAAPIEYVENSILTKDGEERIISWQNSVIQDDGGTIVGILSSGEDITERKHAEEKLVEYSEELRLMSSELSLTEQRERQHIATELHDRIGQSMAVSKLKLEELRRELSETEFEKSVDEVIEIMDQLIGDTRSLTFDLSPPVLFILGLEAALEWLAEQFQEKHGLKVTFQWKGAGRKLDKDIAFVLFRSTQELLINIVKHSRADVVSISMKKSRGKIQINVRDNGVGFDPKEIKMPTDSTGGLGIFSIRERRNYLGGQFRVEAKPGCGSSVTMVVPLNIQRKRSTL